MRLMSPTTSPFLCREANALSPLTRSFVPSLHWPSITKHFLLVLLGITLFLFLVPVVNLILLRQRCRSLSRWYWDLFPIWFSAILYEIEHIHPIFNAGVIGQLFHSLVESCPGPLISVSKVISFEFWYSGLSSVAKSCSLSHICHLALGLLHLGLTISINFTTPVVYPSIK